MTVVWRRVVRRLRVVLAAVAAGLLLACAPVGGADFALTGQEVPYGYWSDETLSSSAMNADGPYVTFLQKSIRKSGWMTIEMEPAGSAPLADPYVVVMRQVANVYEEVATDDDSGPGLAARCSFMAVPGQYVFALSSRERHATGGYRCRLMPGKAAANLDSRDDAPKPPMPDLAATLTAWLKAD